MNEHLSGELSNRLALRPGEVAEALGVGERTVREWMRHEGLPYARVGRLVLIRKDDLQQWLERRIEATTASDRIAAEILDNLT